MLIDRPQVTETSFILNAVVASGPSNPPLDTSDVGELFFNTTLGQLVVYTGTAWVEAGFSGLADHAANSSLHLSTAQNTLLDGLSSSLTSAEVNRLVGVASPIQPQLNTLTANLAGEVSRATGVEAGLQSQINAGAGGFSAHAGDHTLHLSTAQNTLLDGLASTLTATELNFVDGVTSPIQEQLQTGANNLVAHAGDQTLHLTSAQNTLLDGLASTLTATELNFVDGVTSPIQGQLDVRLRLNGADTMSGPLHMGGQRIVGVGTPTHGADAATKDYVDTFVQGLSWKEAVRVATTSNISLNGLQTINGVSLVLNDRVLVKDQTATATNGIYLVSPSAWSRSPDADSSAKLDGAAVFVRGGTVDADSAWIQVNPIAAIGTSAVSWSPFAASGGAAAGVGIDIANSLISVDYGNGLAVSDNSLVVNINTVDFSFSEGRLNLKDVGGLTAGTYGSGTQVPVIVVNAKGQVTQISTVSMAGGQTTDADLTAIADIPDGQFGLVARTGNGAAAVRSLAATGSSVTVDNAGGVAGNPTININDTSASVVNRIVSRDGVGNFAANIITASLNGNATTATTAINSTNATLAAKASTLAQGGGNGAGMTFNWAGQPGQPPWLWGGSDGINHFVYDPSNFNVNFANTAGSAGTATTATNSGQLGGAASDEFFRFRGTVAASNVDGDRLPGSYTLEHAGFSEMLLEFKASSSTPRLQVTAHYDDELYFRVARDSMTQWDGVTQKQKRILHSANFNLFAPSLTGGGASGTWGINITGNSATVGGLSATSSATGSTVAARDGAGDIFARYFNQSSANDENPPIGQVMVTSGDNFLRKASVSHLTASLSGTANINVTGNSATTSQTIFSTLTVLSEQNTSFDGSTGGLIVEAGTALGPATMSFHRPGAYGLNMGLDTDNVFRIAGWSAADNLFQLDMSGNLIVTGNITAYSDRRLKTDVEVITDALYKVEMLVGVTFARIDNNERGTGLIAQDVQQVVPEAVAEDANGIMSVAYGNMVGLLVEAIKELHREVQDIKRRLP